MDELKDEAVEVDLATEHDDKSSTTGKSLDTDELIDEEEREDDEEEDDEPKDEATLWELDPNWGERGGKVVRPIFAAARRYAKARDSFLDNLCHPWLTIPLLGPLAYRWWAIDINLLELLFFSAVFAGATGGGLESNFGIATGIITMLVVGTIPRNNIVRFVLGVPFERMIKYHRWCGYYLAVPLFLHALLYMDFFEDYTHITGFVGWVAFMGIACTSIIIFRRHYFEFFYFIHILFIVYVAAAIAHEPINAGFVAPGMAMYCLDLVLRVTRYWTTSAKTLSITQHDEDLSVLRLPKPFDYKAGQYGFILIPSVSRLNWHPYSISSAPQESTITFHVADNGGWSHAVTRIPDSKQITVKIDGPYGKVGVRYRRQKTVAIFCAGVGATPMMSILKDIYFRRQAKGEKGCAVEKVYFFWSVPRIGCVDWFADDLRKLITRPLDNLDIELNVHVTRSTKRMQAMLGVENGNPLGVPVKRGRPDIKAEFDRIKQQVPEGSAVAVLACGPKAFSYGIRKRCILATSPGTRFLYHAETFEF